MSSQEDDGTAVFLSDDQKLDIIRKFILEAPPGELTEVIHDCRVLLDNDALLEAGITDAVEQYNNEQFMTGRIPGKPYQVLVSEHGQIDQGRYIDPKSHMSFLFDHIKHTASDLEPVEKGPHESYRHALDIAVQEYTKDHYPDGTTVTYELNNTIVMCTVDNKYSPNNFWNGRWRSFWTYSVGSHDLKGWVKVNVHYYEDGNVQLNTIKDVHTKLDVSKTTGPTALANTIVNFMTRSETEFQVALNDSCSSLSESLFKSLRRALPITKTKLNWEQVAGYRLGSEIEKK